MSTKKAPKTRAARTSGAAPTPDHERLRVELEVHREELATQNEDLRRSNAALVTAKEHYAQLYDAAPVGYFTLDRDGTIVEANAAGAALVGSARNFLFGRPFDDLVVAAGRASFRNFRERVVLDGGHHAHETLLATARGKTPVRIEGGRVADSPGRNEQCFLCITDETDRRALEEERRQAQARSAEDQRVESLAALASGVAHDFSNLLAVVLTYADLLLLEGDAPARVLEYGRSIREAAARASDLAQQMTAYSGRKLAREEPIDLTGLVQALAAALAKVATGRRLRFELEQGLPPVAGDRAQLEEVVVNLVRNASEASGRDGTVLVCTRAHPAGTAPDRVVLEVADDGKGMDESTRQRAFDPFFSTKFAGRGLGLAIVHGHVRAHGGTASIVTQPHHGACVRVELPAMPRAPGPANDVERPLPWRGSGLMLVVDDEPAVRAAMERALSRLGFQVCSAASGAEALAIVRAPPAPLVGVLLDVTMPQLDGAATLAELRVIDRALPVVLMSGYTKEELAARVPTMANGYLPKPFTLAALQSELEHALGGQLARR